MRLAFVVCGTLNSVSGGFLYDRRLVAGLRAAGVDVDVIELPWWRYEAALVQNLLPLPFDARAYDVVVQDELCHPAVVLRNRRADVHVPLVSLVHNLACVQPATRRRTLVRVCERAYLRRVDGVIAVCQDTLREVEKLRGGVLPAVVARPGRDHVVAVEPAVIDRRCDDGGPLRLALVGQVAAHKGLHRLVAVMHGLRGQDVLLEVAGAADGAYVARVRAALGTAGLSERVRFHGQLGPEALAALLARCHLFVMPSDREAYPLGAVEAIAAGLPVLLTSAGGTAEVLGGSDAGWLLAPDDTGGWTARLAALVADRAELRRRSHAARARYLALGTWADTTAVVLPFLKGFASLRR